MNFDAMKVKNEIVEWIRKFFEENGKGCKAVIGISGGKDSSVVAALCVEALGKDRVFGVLMPQGEQHDIEFSEMLVKHLEIESIVVNIGKTVEILKSSFPESVVPSKQAVTNLPPRIRMSTLYYAAQCFPEGGRVANTCNLSEDWVGYSTRYGDSVGDFSPISRLTVAEVKAVGRVLGIPECLIEKKPEDGLSGLTDEMNLGFSYAVLDKYIREGVCEDIEVKAKIDRLHRINEFKLKLMPCYEYEPEN